MISQIDISGFRSIKEAKIPLKKLNILYGQNGSGKSSVMYAPYVFRNFCVNPNQRLNRLFDLGFMNLGGFEEVKNQSRRKIRIRISKNLNDIESKKLSYLFDIQKESIGSIMEYFIDEIGQAAVLIEHPYSLNNKVENLPFEGNIFSWDGLLFQNSNNDIKAKETASILNSLFEEIKTIEFISVKRGFFNQIFYKEPRTDESDLAIQVQEELGLEDKIAAYFFQLFNKTFQLLTPSGSTSFYLKTQNKNGITTDLVNEGFGVNQTVYMLIKLLKNSTSLAFIEEPEIHLHPSAQAKLVDVFAEIVQKENKQIFITTHSENIVSSVLAKIADGELSRDDVQFYLAKKEDDETKIIPQEVNDKGQIEGGLMNFMEAELSNLKSLLGL